MESQDVFRIFRLEKIDPFDARLSVVIVEPHNEVRLIIAQSLQKRGFGQVKTARDGIEGLRLLKENPADILILSDDLECPSAKDFILEIRENKNFERRAVIMLCSPLKKNEFALATDLAVDALIFRPIVLNEVLAKIKLAHENYSNQKNIERFFELAKKELREGHPEKAEQIYQALISVNKQLARPYFGLSKIAEEQSRIDDALELAKSAIARNEDYAHAHSLLGELLLKSSDTQGALESFKKSIYLSPLNFFRYDDISIKLMKQNMFDEAISILQIGFDAKLNQPLITERLGLCHFFKKDYTKALRFLRLATEREPENIRFLNSLAICYRDAKQYDKSLETYNQILKNHPENYEVLFNKALLLWLVPRKDEALKLLQRVVAARPDFKKAQEKLQDWISNST